VLYRFKRGEAGLYVDAQFLIGFDTDQEPGQGKLDYRPKVADSSPVRRGLLCPAKTLFKTEAVARGAAEGSYDVGTATTKLNPVQPDISAESVKRRPRPSLSGRRLQCCVNDCGITKIVSGPAIDGGRFDRLIGLVLKMSESYKKAVSLTEGETRKVPRSAHHGLRETVVSHLGSERRSAQNELCTAFGHGGEPVRGER
jgi:hypothetical protein